MKYGISHYPAYNSAFQSEGYYGVYEFDDIGYSRDIAHFPTLEQAEWYLNTLEKEEL